MASRFLFRRFMSSQIQKQSKGGSSQQYNRRGKNSFLSMLSEQSVSRSSVLKRDDNKTLKRNRLSKPTTQDNSLRKDIKIYNSKPPKSSKNFEKHHKHECYDDSENNSGLEHRIKHYDNKRQYKHTFSDDSGIYATKKYHKHEFYDESENYSSDSLISTRFDDSYRTVNGSLTQMTKKKIYQVLNKKTDQHFRDKDPKNLSLREHSSTFIESGNSNSRPQNSTIQPHLHSRSFIEELKSSKSQNKIDSVEPSLRVGNSISSMGSSLYLDSAKKEKKKKQQLAIISSFSSPKYHKNLKNNRSLLNNFQRPRAKYSTPSLRSIVSRFSYSELHPNEHYLDKTKTLHKSNYEPMKAKKSRNPSNIPRQKSTEIRPRQESGAQKHPNHLETLHKSNYEPMKAKNSRYSSNIPRQKSTEIRPRHQSGAQKHSNHLETLHKSNFERTKKVKNSRCPSNIPTQKSTEIRSRQKSGSQKQPNRLETLHKSNYEPMKTENSRYPSNIPRQNSTEIRPRHQSGTQKHPNHLETLHKSNYESMKAKNSRSSSNIPRQNSTEIRPRQESGAQKHTNHLEKQLQVHHIKLKNEEQNFNKFDKKMNQRHRRHSTDSWGSYNYVESLTSIDNDWKEDLEDGIQVIYKNQKLLPTTKPTKTNSIRQQQQHPRISNFKQDKSQPRQLSQTKLSPTRISTAKDQSNKTLQNKQLPKNSQLTAPKNKYSQNISVKPKFIQSRTPQNKLNNIKRSKVNDYTLYGEEWKSEYVLGNTRKNKNNAKNL